MLGFIAALLERHQLASAIRTERPELRRLWGRRLIRRYVQDRQAEQRQAQYIFDESLQYPDRYNGYIQFPPDPPALLARVLTYIPDAVSGELTDRYADEARYRTGPPPNSAAWSEQLRERAGPLIFAVKSANVWQIYRQMAEQKLSQGQYVAPGYLDYIDEQIAYFKAEIGRLTRSRSRP